MQSNRADFLEMREHDAIDNPHDYERPEEKKPMCIDDWLEKYEADQRAKEKEVFGDMLDILNINHSDIRSTLKRDCFDRVGLLNTLDFHSCFRPVKGVRDVKQLVYHNHAKPLTAVQKLHFVPASRENPERIKEMQNAFKNLKSININKYCHGHS